MVAATRYADQYDGFLVGNPGNDLPQAAVSQLYGVQQFNTLIPQGTALDSATAISAAVQATVTPEEYSLIASAVAKQCDGLDGAADGMVMNTTACQDAFDLDRDVATCATERDGSCLTSEQKLALGNIMKIKSLMVPRCISTFPMILVLARVAGLTGKWLMPLAVTLALSPQYLAHHQLSLITMIPARMQA